MIYNWQYMDLPGATLYDANGLEWKEPLQQVDTETGICLYGIGHEDKMYHKVLKIDAVPLRVDFGTPENNAYAKEYFQDIKNGVPRDPNAHVRKEAAALEVELGKEGFQRVK